MAIETGMRAAMADQFGAHHPKHGPRLGQIQKLNRGGLARFARAEEVSEGEIERSQGRLGAILGAGADDEAAAAPVEGVKAGNDNRPRRVGRPRIEGVRPWEALGVSRAEYFRRRKAGKA